jgi:hypothetical protein
MLITLSELALEPPERPIGCGTGLPACRIGVQNARPGGLFHSPTEQYWALRWPMRCAQCSRRQPSTQRIQLSMLTHFGIGAPNTHRPAALIKGESATEVDALEFAPETACPARELVRPGMRSARPRSDVSTPHT